MNCHVIRDTVHATSCLVAVGDWIEEEGAKYVAT